MKILVIDNYDSFTYNLVYLIRELGYGDQMDVVRNNRFDMDKVEEYDKILLSPGPGIPSEAGDMESLINRYKTSKEILGICLGHQAIAEVFGGKLRNLDTVLHGIQGKARILNRENVLFKGLDSEIQVGHYHSWIVSEEELPNDLEVNSVSEEGYIMGLSHKDLPVHGLQFHPESILTPKGKNIIKNWLISNRD